MYAPGTNAGHGHVWERPDGIKARCGGPNICRECSADMPPIDFAGLVNPDVIKQVGVARDRRIAELETALRAVVSDIEEYQQINNLFPSPGKPDCWQSVTHAKSVLRVGINENRAIAQGATVIDDEPSIAEMSDPQMLAYCGDDARKWARAFVYFNSSVDEEMMVTWFANAIETADDHRAKRRTYVDEGGNVRHN